MAHPRALALGVLMLAGKCVHLVRERSPEVEGMSWTEMKDHKFRASGMCEAQSTDNKMRN
jgi:hypothetical protein